MKKLIFILFIPLASVFADFSKELGYGLSWFKNTSDTVSLYNYNEVTYHHDQNTKFGVYNSGNYTFKDWSISNYMGEFKLKFDLILAKKHTVFVFDELEINPMLNKKSANTVAAGYKYIFFDVNGVRFDSSIAPIFTHIVYETEGLVTTGFSNRWRVVFAGIENESGIVYFINVNGSVRQVTHSATAYYKKYFNKTFSAQANLHYQYDSLINTSNQGISAFGAFNF